MIIVFIGSPYIGKGTQSKLLGRKLSLPVFSMGELIRNARKAGNKKISEAYDRYVMKGLHIPIEIKFPLLEEKMDQNKRGFILDNFPERQDGLNAFIKYLSDNLLSVDKVLLLKVLEKEIQKRIDERKRTNRPDDTPEILMVRQKVQDRERIPVIDYFKSKGVLEEVNGEGSADNIHKEILKKIGF